MVGCYWIGTWKAAPTKLMECRLGRDLQSSRYVECLAMSSCTTSTYLREVISDFNLRKLATLVAYGGSRAPMSMMCNVT